MIKQLTNGEWQVGANYYYPKYDHGGVTLNASYTGINLPSPPLGLLLLDACTPLTPFASSETMTKGAAAACDGFDPTLRPADDARCLVSSS